MNIYIVGKNNFFGIKEDDKIVVPIQHLTVSEAVDEWEYFEKLNIKEYFMPRIRTIDEIEKIGKALRKTIIYH